MTTTAKADEDPTARRSCCAPTRREAATPLPADVPTHKASSLAPRRVENQAARYEQRVELPGGTFRMGTEDADANPGDGEGPVREVTVAPFAIDAYALTNARFAAFVEQTGYRTEAESFGWSYVFAKFLPGRLRGASRRPPETPWWCAVENAAWNGPEGPGSDLNDRWDHPVVHLTWHDAQAYCRWAGARLPTEAEWEYAARGGLDQARYPWGDELTPGGRHRCNIWQGPFPFRNTEEDGFAGTAPVHAFAANGFGLYNVAGNVWEWTADLWEEGDPGRRSMRGGSYLCHDSYCNRYRVAARTANTADSSAGNLGIRLAWDSGGHAR
ncbi:formylglycine-generating enzyme family protein [Streptomyces indicus]|uniref:Formylglycine-generating enzyme, required for sulfatase activity, contains SUMF1/FGE domain n=1 Tax=Streptomyces indicus TaxID=417292 RepID=A0A1G9GKB8_9ACTN|nr:formylglycine-generating enzyme family protein [Streptomyces indicus]SDL01128.1 Formylglycine-generating enzyme, required for sulfatase activity, contains SUMF1/FGE domain [Streptomyces indicus]